MTKARNLADLLNADGQIDNADIADNTIANAKLAQTPNFRNIIINGDMSIAQRGTSVNVGNNDNGYHTIDRWLFFESGSPTAVFTMSQDTDVPTGQGFAKSLKMDCATAQGSLGASDLIRIEQRLEGQNLQYLKKGTSSAESLTMSFWVKSNKTGTYILELSDADNGRHIANTYTIDSASTWEKKIITFAGDTTGTLDNDNANSLTLRWWLSAGTNFTSGTLATSWQANDNADRAVGQVNLADSTSNYINITGVQLEAGTTASDFEFLPYDVNLQRCQRYYQILADHASDGATTGSFGTGVYYSTNVVYASFPTIVNLRTQPTVDQVSGTDYYVFYSNADGDFFSGFSLGNSSNSRYVELRNSTNVSGTGGDAGFFRTGNADAFIAFDAEL